MTRYTIVVALFLIFAIVGPAQGYQGAAPFGTAIADYDPATGQMSVSVNNVLVWAIRSTSSGLTGDTPLGLPVDGGLVSDSDFTITEFNFSFSNYTDLNLGNVAATGLPLGDLTITWAPDLGVPEGTAPVSYVFGPLVPEPTSLALASFSTLCLGCSRRRRSPS